MTTFDVHFEVVNAAGKQCLFCRHVLAGSALLITYSNRPGRAYACEGCVRDFAAGARTFFAGRQAPAEPTVRKGGLNPPNNSTARPLAPGGSRPLLPRGREARP